MGNSAVPPVHPARSAAVALGFQLTIFANSLMEKQSKNTPATDEQAEDGKRRVTVRYRDEDLEEFRANIQQARLEAADEFQILKENLVELNDAEQADENSSYSMHMAEQGTEAQEKEKIYAQVQRLNDYIKKLDDALQRIDNKTYGICRICGILIAKERLLAVPITTLSASYKIRKKCPEDGVDKIVARQG